MTRTLEPRGQNEVMTTCEACDVRSPIWVCPKAMVRGLQNEVGADGPFESTAHQVYDPNGNFRVPDGSNADGLNNEVCTHSGTWVRKATISSNPRHNAGPSRLCLTMVHGRCNHKHYGVYCKIFSLVFEATTSKYILLSHSMLLQRLSRPPVCLLSTSGQSPSCYSKLGSPGTLTSS